MTQYGAAGANGGLVVQAVWWFRWIAGGFGGLKISSQEAPERRVLLAGSSSSIDDLQVKRRTKNEPRLAVP